MWTAWNCSLLIQSQEGIANLLIPLVIYVAMFLCGLKLALMSLASIPISLLSMVMYVLVGMKRMGPLLSVCTENEQHDH